MFFVNPLRQIADNDQVLTRPRASDVRARVRAANAARREHQELYVVPPPGFSIFIFNISFSQPKVSTI